MSKKTLLEITWFLNATVGWQTKILNAIQVFVYVNGKQKKLFLNLLQIKTNYSNLHLSTKSFVFEI